MGWNTFYPQVVRWRLATTPSFFWESVFMSFLSFDFYECAKI